MSYGRDGVNSPQKPLTAYGFWVFHRKWFLRFAILALPIVLFSFVLWFVTNLMICRPSFHPPIKSPDQNHICFEAQNSNGNKILAWWYPCDRLVKPVSEALLGSGPPLLNVHFREASKKPVILLCHGHGVEHGNLFELLPFLKKAGFSLIFFDFRAHGISEGDYTSIGLNEWEDIDAILQEAKIRGFIQDSTIIIAYGRSMGAATLINGAAHLPQINAFILESSFAELRIIAAQDLKRVTSIPDNPLIDLAFLTAELRTGIPFASNKPVNQIHNIATRPLLLIHDSLDPRATKEDFDRLTKAAKNPRTLIFENAGHVLAYRTSPSTFEQEFLSFVASTTTFYNSINSQN